MPSAISKTPSQFLGATATMSSVRAAHSTWSKARTIAIHRIWRYGRGTIAEYPLAINTAIGYRIIIGDFAGTDLLTTSGNTWNPIALAIVAALIPNRVHAVIRSVVISRLAFRLWMIHIYKFNRYSNILYGR